MRYLQNDAAERLQHIQYKVYKGELTDEDAVSTYFYDLPTTARRKNCISTPRSRREACGFSACQSLSSVMG